MTNYQAWIEEDYAPVKTFSGAMDGTEVTVTRYEDNTDNPFILGGEHITFVSDKGGKLKGLARILGLYQLENTTLPTENESKNIAMNFLESNAPDLIQNMKIQWIKPHDEEVMIDNKKIIITGMKVKCRNLDDGKYFWVIVGHDNSVMVFERDIVWDFFKAGRQTEKWLHDSWLKSQI